MLKVENKGVRPIAVLTSGGIKTVAPGKAESFDEEPLNMKALEDARRVEVSGKVEKAEKTAEEGGNGSGTTDPTQTTPTPTPAPAPQLSAPSKAATPAKK